MCMYIYGLFRVNSTDGSHFTSQISLKFLPHILQPYLGRIGKYYIQNAKNFQRYQPLNSLGVYAILGIFSHNVNFCHFQNDIAPDPEQIGI